MSQFLTILVFRVTQFQNLLYFHSVFIYSSFSGLFWCSTFLSAATGMKWIEAKMKELGVTSNSSYKISFMLDSCAMISIHTPKYGVIEVCVHAYACIKQTYIYIIIQLGHSPWLITRLLNNNPITNKLNVLTRLFSYHTGVKSYCW